MKKLYQREWFEIDFSDLGVSLSTSKTADISFYEAFYNHFFDKYTCYESLPSNWKALKNEITNHLAGECSGGGVSLLSIGCGIGYIENELQKRNESIEIVALEPSANMAEWMDSSIKVLHGTFPEVLQDKYDPSDFDMVYASGIDYVFDDNAYASFLKSVYDFGVKDFLLTEVFLPNNSLKSTVKDGLKNLLMNVGIIDNYQLWGYLREVSEHVCFLRDAGFSDIESGDFNHGACWIRARR